MQDIFLLTLFAYPKPMIHNRKDGSLLLRIPECL